MPPLKKQLNYLLFLFLLSFFISNHAIANMTFKTGAVSTDISTIKTSYKQKKYQQLINDGENFLKTHPLGQDDIVMIILINTLAQYLQ